MAWVWIFERFVHTPGCVNLSELSFSIYNNLWIHHQHSSSFIIHLIHSSNSSSFIFLIHPPSILYLFAIAGIVSRRGRLGLVFHGLRIGSSRDSFIHWCGIISRILVILTLLHFIIIILLKHFSLLYMRSYPSHNFYFHTFFIIRSFYLLFNLIETHFHYPTYFTIRLSNVIRFGHDHALIVILEQTGVAQRAARGAHNPEDIGSNPISGILLFAMLYRSSPSFLCDVKLR